MTCTVVSTSTGAPFSRKVVLPSFNGIDCGRREQRVATDQFDVIDIAVPGDIHFQDHDALDMLCLRLRRVDWVNVATEAKASSHVLGNAHTPLW